ncbi:MAG: hypothetical protein ACI9BF_000201 [Candidatus Paceibacteria bacterium]|jgi:hypothetical protein
MDTFFSILKKSLVATIFAIFAFVGTYIPQNWNMVEIAHAGGAMSGGASEWTQIGNNIQLGAVNATTGATAAATTVTAVGTGSMVYKEIADAIFWSLAKSAVSSMASSIVSWINSGFEGSPAFVTNLDSFLLNVADEAFGSYMEELGGNYSFICSPFSLDVRLALALQYQQTRNQEAAPTCTFSGALANIEDFIGGTGGLGSFSENGGWKNWIKITTQSQTYTPYGSVLSAQVEMKARLINAKGEEIKLLEFGDGFLSMKSCETVPGPEKREVCGITTPGKVIEDSLTFNLSTGQRSLIAADEVNEIIGALIGQLGVKVITGASGLLGLSPGTGYTESDYDGDSLIAGIRAESLDLNADKIIVMIEKDIATQVSYTEMIVDGNYEDLLRTYADNLSNSDRARSLALDAIDDIAAIEIAIDINDVTLNDMIDTLNDEEASGEDKSDVINQYMDSRPDFFTMLDVTSSDEEWNTILRMPEQDSDPIDYDLLLTELGDALVTQQALYDLATSSIDDLIAIEDDTDADAQDRADAATYTQEARLVVANTKANGTNEGYIAELTEMITALTILLNPPLVECNGRPRDCGQENDGAARQNSADKLAIANAAERLEPEIYKKSELNAYTVNWSALLN